jgi:chromosome segregation ATPase
MRMTPQPQGVPSSSIGNDNEITRISDSMPGTATNDVASLQAQLVLMEQALKDEHAAREADQKRFREQAVMWDKQQTVHEDSNKEHRILKHQHHQLEEKVKAMTTNTETLRTRLETRTAEHRALVEQLQKQRETHSLSDDEKVAEITNLRTELAQAIAEKERVERHAVTVEKTLDFVKEQYRDAQNAAGSALANVKELEKQNAKLTHQASGEVARLKLLHIDTVTSTLQTQVKSQAAEISILKKTNQLTQDENARLKASSGRMGVGTRGTTPKTGSRSRAASPAMSRASGLSNFRN